MTLSGMVYKTKNCGKDVLVLLAAIEDEQGYISPVGQRRLLIKNCTICPLPGDIIWGGDESAQLERGVQNKQTWHYRRDGYVYLVEDFK